LRIVVDKNIPYVREMFQRFGDVIPVETGAFTPQLVREAEAVIVRSETPVGSELLGGSCVRFVGTATIGTDHIDIPYLAEEGIAFASAPGCNANSVAEYVAAALLALAGRNAATLRGKALGVVGVGNVGSNVVKKAEALGMRILLNDPPLARLTGDKKFVPLEALMEADFLTLHVPLSAGGTDPTLHLFDEKRLNMMKPGAVLINTSRGAVVDGGALAEALGARHLSAAVLDVWEGEPAIAHDLLDRVFIGTPHIAGYSLDGKLKAVRMMAEAFCSFAGADRSAIPPLHLPPPAIERVLIPRKATGGDRMLAEIVRAGYDIEKDDRRLRGIGAVPKGGAGTYFRQLRIFYPVRREFAATTVVLSAEHQSLAAALAGLGFTVIHAA